MDRRHLLLARRSCLLYGSYGSSPLAGPLANSAVVVDNGEDTAEGMNVYLRDGASGSLAKEFHG